MAKEHSGSTPPPTEGWIGEHKSGSEVGIVAEQNLVIEPHSEHIAKGCPTCNRGIEEGQTVVLCPICRTVHHENCWYDQGGCGKRGCRGVASKRPDSVGRPAARPGLEDEADEGTLSEITPVAPHGQLPMAIFYAVLAIVLLVLIYYFLLR